MQLNFILKEMLSQMIKKQQTQYTMEIIIPSCRLTLSDREVYIISSMMVGYNTWTVKESAFNNNVQ